MTDHEIIAKIVELTEELKQQSNYIDSPDRNNLALVAMIRHACAAWYLGRAEQVLIAAKPAIEALREEVERYKSRN